MLFLMGVSMMAQGQAEAPSAPRVNRVSAHITREVMEKLPKYGAVAPVEPARRPEVSDGLDSSDDVLRLPKVTVTRRKPPPMDDFSWLTPKARLDLALKTQPGLRLGNIAGLNNGIASAMQAEDRSVKSKAVLVAEVQVHSSDNSDVSKRIRRLLQAAIQRPNADWLAGRSR